MKQPKITQIFQESFEANSKNYTHPSSSYVFNISEEEIQLILTGRDSSNYSKLFKFNLNLKSDKINISEPILNLGQASSLDHMGASYPCITKFGDKQKMFYTGWSKSQTKPFKNTLFSSCLNLEFPQKEVIKIQLGDETLDEIGSIDIKKFNGFYYMLFTQFKCWNGHEPAYNINAAKSLDLKNWVADQRFNLSAINTINSEMICRPSIIESNSKFYMFFCHRPESKDYSIGIASSDDFFNWSLESEDIFKDWSMPLWCNMGQSYPHVTFHSFHNNFYLFFAGNQYGKEGFGYMEFEELKQLF